MPTGNSPFGTEAVNGKIYILGSERENGELSLDVKVFDTGFRAVTATGNSPHAGANSKQNPKVNLSIGNLSSFTSHWILNSPLSSSFIDF